VESVNKPFGPALNAAVNLLSQQFQQNLNQILNEEAASLGLAEGWQANVEARVWIVPSKAEEPVAEKTAPALVRE
jgi:hypothetical protein